jgi:hypothetical protein
MNIDKLEIGTKVLIKAWDHNASDIVETVATYNGWCDHPEWGAAVNVSYENTGCHIDETETDIPVSQFQKNTIKLAEVA